jgi:hypothetical protein
LHSTMKDEVTHLNILFANTVPLLHENDTTNVFNIGRIYGKFI